MAVTFIGDRFVSIGHGWLDIVTGRAVSLRVGAPPADLAARERACRERWSLMPTGNRLVDFGRQGSVGWFEAEQSEPAAAPITLRQLMWPEVGELSGAIAAGDVTGVVSIDAPPGTGFQILCGQLARAVRDAGFVTVRVDAPLPFRLRRHLLHRHLVLLVADDQARAFAAGWLAQLAIMSDRHHIVIERDGCVANAIRLRPFERASLLSAVIDAGGMAADAIETAATASGGWPASFARRLSQVPAAANIVRERAEAFVPALMPMPIAPAIERHLARASSYARRRRPMAESEWHSAAVAAAMRRGDVPGSIRATERWVLRLIDEGRYARAVDVATRALGRAAGDIERRELMALAARAHLAAAQLARAETLATAVLESSRLSATASASSGVAHGILVEALFWKGRWQEMRELLARDPSAPANAEWRRLL
ncbi:MAG: hypothetical protein EPO35_11720, partial [Acidobacteria bacterium]